MKRLNLIFYLLLISVFFNYRPISAQSVNLVFKKTISLQKIAQLIDAVPLKPERIQTLGNIEPYTVVSVKWSEKINPDSLTAALSTVPEFEFLEPNFVYRLHQVQSLNDPLLTSQWYFSYMNAMYFYREHPGIQREIIVGIIDSGIDYQHEDLEEIFWINTAEDINHNGRLDSLDINGVDDDGNGYVDDVIGYDFVDSPDLPAPGDYLGEDPFPDDEFGSSGHGTGVAGIIAAMANNEKGIAGISPAAKIMNLRTGSALGYLETDDVVKAILYAVNNGADIINMSFGDQYASRLLKLAIDYAHRQGVLLIASAGNNGTDDPVYPAAFENVIGVSAINSNGQPAGFSNFGEWISLAAPGQSLLTTVKNNQYRELSGTSFSAPIVSAIASLMFTQHPTSSVDEISSMMMAASYDPPPTAFDPYYGYGIPIEPQIFSSTSLHVRLWSPMPSTLLSSGQKSIVATVFGENIKSYHFSLEYLGQTLWNGDEHHRMVVRDTVDVIPESVFQFSGKYLLQLAITRFDGEVERFTFPLNISDNLPEITQKYHDVILDGSRVKDVLKMKSSLPTLVKIASLTDHEPYYLSEGFTGEHFFTITGNQDDSLVISYFPEQFPDQEIPEDTLAILSNGEKIIEPIFPNSTFWDGQVVFLKTLTDVNQNLIPEVVYSDVTDGFLLKMDELVPTNREIQRELLAKSQAPWLPYFYADLNEDSTPDLVTGFSGKTAIFSFDETIHFGSLNEAAFLDSINCWPAGMCDINRDGRPELVVRKNNIYQIWHFSPDWQMEKLLEIPLSQEKLYGVPRVFHGYFTTMENEQLLVADGEGNIYLTTVSADYQVIRQISFNVGVAFLTDYADLGDVDRDGLNELYFMVLDSINLMSDKLTSDAFWKIQMLNFEQEKPVLQSVTNIKGINMTDPVPEGIILEDSLMVLTNGVHGYHLIFDGLRWNHHYYFNNSKGPVAGYSNFSGQLFYFGSRNGNSFIADVSEHMPFSKPDVAFYQKKDTIFLEYNHGGNDSLWMELWSNDSLRDSAFVFKDTLFRYTGFIIGDSVSCVITPDREKRQTVLYSEAVIFHELTQIETNLISTENLLIKLESDIAFASGESMEPVFYLKNSGIAPSSVFRGKNGKELLLFFMNIAGITTDTLIIRDLMDNLGAKIDTSVVFSFTQSKYFGTYPETAYMIARDTLIIQFSDLLEQSSYPDSLVAISPDVQIVDVLRGNDQREIVVVVDPYNPLGGFGKRGSVTIKPFLNFGKFTADNQNVTIPISNEVGSLDEVVIFPNPVYAHRHEELIIGRIPEGTVLKILNINGSLVWEKQVSSGENSCRINIKKELENIGSGVYIMLVRHEDATRVLKLFIIK